MQTGIASPAVERLHSPPPRAFLRGVTFIHSILADAAPWESTSGIIPGSRGRTCGLDNREQHLKVSSFFYVVKREPLSTPGVIWGCYDLIRGEDMAENVYVEEDFRDGVSFERAERARFERCRFQGASLVEWETVGAVFDRCDFDGARLNSSRHVESAFLNCSFEGANFFAAEFVRCKMIGSTFPEVNWHGIRIESGNWSYCNLRYADLSHVNFREANLRDVDVSHANLLEGCFQGADMSQAILTRANIKGADFRGADLTGIDFRLLALDRVRLDYDQAVQVVLSLGARVD